MIIYDFMKMLFDGPRTNLGYLMERWNRYKRKRKVGHKEGIMKGSYYNKAMLRCYVRSKKPDWARKAEL
jgi:hypothetical protein